MSAKKTKACATCLASPVRFTKNCSQCRSQWKAFYAGRTNVSPMMRAITGEQISLLEKGA